MSVPPTKDELEEDWYGILQVPFQSEVDVIKAGFRKRAKVMHPDKNRDNPKAGASIISSPHPHFPPPPLVTPNSTHACCDA